MCCEVRPQRPSFGCDQVYSGHCYEFGQTVVLLKTNLPLSAFLNLRIFWQTCVIWFFTDMSKIRMLKFADGTSTTNIWAPKYLIEMRNPPKPRCIDSYQI